MKKKYKRLFLILGIFFFFNCAIFFVLTTLKENISFFYTVSEAMILLNNQNKQKSVIRIGGMVIENSVIHNDNEIIFQITDFNKSIKVKYYGILPPMFSEKSGVVVQGQILKNGIFLANTVLAKHDENYMRKKK
ncbi:MAG: cytochrome c maturation protein CcmE [Wolbachia endosymbiont of Menacanthus eurysternus]|nr:MAG: cytochrome c maturation protein CcmE [Wolbachia endosymbiont of Menacanthus eurysternus]